MQKTDYVDTSIGTVGDEQAESFHGGGKTYPGACLPGGMVQVSPDTVTAGDNGTGYNYCHNTIEGFSFNHLSGIGWFGDLGNVQIMPTTVIEDLRSGSNREIPFRNGTQGWKSAFSHETEVTKAGYYAVELERYRIFAEATATERVGFLRFTYPKDADANLIVNLSRRIGGKADWEEAELVSDRRIEGHIRCTPKGGGLGHGDGHIAYDLYFVCEFSAPAQMQFFADEAFCDAGLRRFAHEDLGIAVRFGQLQEPLVVRCGISYVDMAGARNNLATESDSFDFDSVRQNAAQAWQNAFDGVWVEGSNETDLTLFYTCLYHALLDPRTAMDCDGRFALNDRVFAAPDYTQRTVFSGWDVYRSEFPLLSLIRPRMVRDTVSSLLKVAQERGTSLPRWELLGIDTTSMVGDPAAIVICDAAAKGIEPYDKEAAYAIIRASVLCEKELNGKPFTSARPDCKAYVEDAYVPERLSNTLEYLLADYAAASLAEQLGKTEDAEFLRARAMRYGENYNPELGFLAPRTKDGAFVFEADRYDDDGCVESNIFQQGWFVPWDIEGLFALMGRERAMSLLEEFFSRADFSKLWNEDYNHSNEPCHNITHYFDVLGQPERTQYWTRRVQKEAYRKGAFGFCGNEDVGQLSAWYVLSALGFAQICPTDLRYWLNTPLFAHASVRLDPDYHGCRVADTLTIKCDHDPLEYPYIDSVALNGVTLDRYYLTYDELTNGGTVLFRLKQA
ncbi:MAG: GH92 family glycosyl hydrolase [Clostridia bacterium]|nr:GH92 family glycosyl hydrolase [Clostridia bacterium]